MTTSAPPPTAPGTPTDRRETPRLLCALVLLTVPACCLWQVLDLLFHLFGESATPAEEAAASRWLSAAVLVALGSSAGGVALSTGRRGATVGFGIGLALSLGLAVVAAPLHADLRPAPERVPGTTCQERSGGTSDCSGG